MALIEALLLDPYRMNMWVAARNDGVSGGGTHNDPFDGSTQAKFDAVMNSIVATSNLTGKAVCVHLGPGTFQTNGYADSVSGGWQPNTGMKIVGSGIDVTVLQLVNTNGNAHYYAIGHNVSGPTTVHFFEVSDLTIDCNLAGAGGITACGAVRVLGNHARVRHIKVINWGTNSITQPCFVISVITATGQIQVEDCGIEDCVALSPASNGSPADNIGPITVFHAGSVEMVPSSPPPNNPPAYGVGA